MSENPAAITVTELNRRARALLEDGMARVWVVGELSNLARPASGHLYFSLKDDSAQIRCAYFLQRQRGPTTDRSTGSRSGFRDGDRMLAFGRISIYEARGDYQLIVEQLEPAGEGALRRQFEVLKKKLSDEGLFDPARKKALPALPARIGVITSPSGAAIRDILSVLRRRFPGIPVLIYPAAVQGEAAAPELRAALATAVRRNECDVLIISRGGGSLEDLWAFNDEKLARAIAECPIPVVSAVGHEVDFTICDFVADLRAPTPSGAAEIVVPDQAEWRRNFALLARRNAVSMRRHLQDRFQRLDWLSRHLMQCSPAAILARQKDWLRNMRQLLLAAMRHDVGTRVQVLGKLQSRLLHQSPALNVQRQLQRLANNQQRLSTAAAKVVDQSAHRLKLAARGLHTVSPLATLDRGYAIVTDRKSGRILSNAASVAVGDAIEARLATGSIAATVTGKSGE
ncbi:MAG: exodeoxyribonuclease VII large subunit [Gammaproteobacteria bacterium]|nr:exodeoxyribonuclease VII large subunit [Gammaproteobacteria bacterium]MDH4315874.1 exodeoxyribonuclease VII large subunit [Gammaproteobacteria bacterium]